MHVFVYVYTVVCRKDTARACVYVYVHIYMYKAYA